MNAASLQTICSCSRWPICSLDHFQVLLGRVAKRVALATNGHLGTAIESVLESFLEFGDGQMDSKSLA